MADEKLTSYRAKRDLSKTPEPSGEEPAQGSGNRFVIHEHQATNLHWDLRLERDGVLVCWALPKGIPRSPEQKHNRLAVHVEDHPLKYIDFDGEIPAGNYGAGEMAIWDSGTYETEKFRKDEVIVTLHGESISGKYVLFQTGGKNWMIHRMDPPIDPAREDMPEAIEPMVAKPGKPDEIGKEWLLEPCWPGVRAQLYDAAGHIHLVSQEYGEVKGKFPEVRPLARSFGMEEIVLDGVLTVGADPESLQRRMAAKSDSTVKRIAEGAPALFMIFDLLFLYGHSTLTLPYGERRRFLESLELDGLTWKLSPSYGIAFDDFRVAAKEQGLKKIVAKDPTAQYVGGKSPDWLEIPV